MTEEIENKTISEAEADKTFYIGEVRQEYATKLLSRILSFFKLHGIRYKIASLGESDTVIVMKGFHKRDLNTTIRMIKDMSRKAVKRIKISDDLNIKMVRVPGKGVAIYTYYNGEIIGKKLIRPDEYFELSRFFSIEEDVLEQNEILRKLSSKPIDRPI